MRSNADITVAELRDKFGGTAIGASLDFVIAQNHDARCRAVQAAIDFACNENNINRKNRNLGKMQ
jgi:hypothetical protein